MSRLPGISLRKTLAATLVTMVLARTGQAGDHLGAYPITEAHLDAPFWRSRAIHGESVLFLKEANEAQADGTLLLRPATVHRVRNAQTGEVYRPGVDYQVDAAKRRLVTVEGSKIPVLDHSELTRPPRSPGAIPHKLGDPETWILYQENGFHARQVEVDYDADEPWTGKPFTRPEQGLARVIARLEAGKPLSLVIAGDSISTGANASRAALPPHMPAYPELVSAGLEGKFKTQVKLLNVSVGGASVDGAMKAVDTIVAAQPNLVVVAYGMNDVASHDPARYAAGTRKVIETIRARVPEAEFVVVATSRGNPAWVHTPADQFPRFLEALEGLRSDHVALLDLTTLWGQILDRKRFTDTTGNGVNHPNDWGHRVYAQALLDLLTVDQAPKP